MIRHAFFKKLFLISFMNEGRYTDTSQFPKKRITDDVTEYNTCNYPGDWCIIHLTFNYTKERGVESE